ncbi:vitamin k epoxide reductase complex subunit 1 [Holotrichia oblita]|uniref:Vitamin k epoxide reductase complex subunit 1 n=1 Tax=Holotrichia oblita TaxID=644536 RepID=A0ACB9SR47_HOLOL|nr:vitamin k epoxide reductase complex subunit 1 [Holotrichia oblita]
MVSVRVLNVLFTLSSFIGLALSIYAFIVEQAAAKDANYKAMCDINEFISCSTVFKSEYATGFGLASKFLGKDSFFNKPNSLFGIAFYSLIIVLAQFNSKSFAVLNLLFSTFSVWLSVYLAYLLVFVIRSLCIICAGTYVVNIINFASSYYKFKKLSEPPAKVQKSKKKKA